MTALSDRLTSRERPWVYLPEFAQATLPRYTSYPPANRFGPAIGPKRAMAELQSLPSQASLSLYIHIPFCRRLCWYCGCHTSVPTEADPVDAYLAALHQEIELVGRQITDEAKVVRLHFGGGSPDILTPRQIATLFEALRRNFVFDRFAEIAAELDPRGVTGDLANALAAQGLNRVSLGVQVLDHAIQERINRVQPPEQVAAAIALLRTAGLEALNIDMMYGLPGQTIDHVVETATFAATHDADRIAVFGYAHVPWFKKHQKAIATDSLPDSEQRFRQAEAASRTLQRAGYMPVGFDHFAAPGDSLVTAERSGRLRRNFQGYTDDNADALLGFGASAISSLPGLMWQNATDSSAYKLTLSNGVAPVVRGVSISPDDRSIGRLIERLLCDFEARIPRELLARALPGLAPALSAGLAERVGDHLIVTDRGRPYVRNIASIFDAAHTVAPGRHSLAI